jgi:predicted nucleotidyltransferase
MINIEQRHLDMVMNILKKYDYTFYIFGSRITEKAKKFSDLDLFYIDPIPEKTLYLIKEEFEESNLPYTVDLVNYQKCKPYFKEIIKQNYQLLYKSSRSENVDTQF